MEHDSEKILISILEESPVYLSLKGHERRLLIEDLKIVYPYFFKTGYKDARDTDEKYQVKDC